MARWSIGRQSRAEQNKVISWQLQCERWSWESKRRIIHSIKHIISKVHDIFEFVALSIHSTRSYLTHTHNSDTARLLLLLKHKVLFKLFITHNITSDHCVLSLFDVSCRHLKCTGRTAHHWIYTVWIEFYSKTFCNFDDYGTRHFLWAKLNEFFVFKQGDDDGIISTSPIMFSLVLTTTE